MTVVATGANFKLYSAEEITEATAPGGNWQQLPCMLFELAGSQNLVQDQVLSTNLGRDASEPYLDGVQMVKGNARVPIDSISFGFWLKMLLGAPVTTAVTAPAFSHMFTSGGQAFPTRSFEKAFPAIGKYYVDTGVRADSMTIATTINGAAEATVALMGLQEIVAGTASIAGQPNFSPLRRFMQQSGQVLLNGTVLAGITAGSINFSNNLKEAATLRNDNRLDGLDYGQATAGGSLTLRFSGAEGIDAAALAVTPLSVVYTLVMDANNSISFTFPQCWFKPVGPAISTPDAITRGYTFIAGNDGTTGDALMTVLYVNTISNY